MTPGHKDLRVLSLLSGDTSVSARRFGKPKPTGRSLKPPPLEICVITRATTRRTFGLSGPQPSTLYLSRTCSAARTCCRALLHYTEGLDESLRSGRRGRNLYAAGTGLSFRPLLDRAGRVNHAPSVLRTNGPGCRPCTSTGAKRAAPPAARPRSAAVLLRELSSGRSRRGATIPIRCMLSGMMTICTAVFYFAFVAASTRNATYAIWPFLVAVWSLGGQAVALLRASHE